MMCSNCGNDMGEGRFCGKCGQMRQQPTGQPPTGQPPQWSPPAQSAGQPQWQPGPAPGGQWTQPGQSQWQPAPGGSSKDKMTAGLLAIFIGAFGVHKFYLGGPKQKNAAILQIVLTVVTCGAAGVLAFIEGIIYLTKNDQQFQAEYVHGDRNWF